MTASRGTAPPSLAELQEALRNVHNLNAEFASLQTLERSLQVSLAAATGYEALVKQHEGLVAQIAEAQAALAGWHTKVSAITVRYQQREAEAEQTLQARITEWTQQQEQAEHAVTAAKAELRTLQQTIGQEQQRRTAAVKQAAEEERARHTATIGALQEQITVLQREITQLTQKRDALQLTLADIARRATGG